MQSKWAWLWLYLVLSNPWLARNCAVAQQGLGFDGQINDFANLVSKTGELELLNGLRIEGTIEQFLMVRGKPGVLQAVELEVSRRSRKFLVQKMQRLWVDGREIALETHFPSGKIVLIDVAAANSIAEQRLQKIGHLTRPALSKAEFLQASSTSDRLAAKAENAISNPGVQQLKSNSLILVSDFGPRSRQLVAALEKFRPALNEMFGFDEDEFPLPGRPIVGAFQIRENLAKFESRFVGYKDYGDIKAFYHMVEDRVVICGNDKTSARHLLWQLGWALSGAYESQSFSNAPTPSWLRAGIQQVAADILVPKVSNFSYEQKQVSKELEGGSLNGLLDAQGVSGSRHYICKGIVAHLYRKSPAAFRQMHRMIKHGRSQEEAIQVAYGVTQQQLVASYGKSVGVANLVP